MKNLFSMWLLATVLALGVGKAFGQFTWTKDVRNPVLVGGNFGQWNAHIFEPCVLFNTDSSRYEMWFAGSTGAPGPNNDYHPYKIGYASSTDGIHWSMYPSPVLSPTVTTWDAYTTDAPMVIRENGQYKMWYTSFLSPTSPDYLGYATSPDGIHWTKYSGNPVMGPGTAAWEVAGPYGCSIIPFKGGYKMWYAGVDATFLKDNIGYATSADGIVWLKDTVNNPVLRTGAAFQWDDGFVGAPQVLLMDNACYMWYTGYRSSTGPRAAGVATSNDTGKTWTKYAYNPVLFPSGVGWDGTWLEGGSVLQRGDTLDMWYAADVSPISSNRWSIGHATAPLPRVRHRVPQDFATIQAAINAALVGDSVLVSEGTYKENIVLTKKITVASNFILDNDTSHITKTIIDGSQPHTLDSASVVTIDGATDTSTVLAGFTLTGGKGNWRHVNWPNIVYDMRLGTGVDVAGGGAHIHHNVIRANNVNDPNNALGGVVNIFDVSDKNGVSYVVVDHNTVSDNVLVGKDCEGGAFVVIHDASIYANIIERNIATGVSADGDGAAFLIQNGTVKVDGNRIVGNSASHYGGGFSIYSVDIAGAVPHVTLTNNIVANNSAGRNGGGMFAAKSDVLVTMINNTFVSNTAAISGSGITIDSATVGGLNTILWDPGKPEIQVTHGNLIVSYCDIQGGYAGTGNINADPGFFSSRPDSLCWFRGTSPCANAGIASASVGGTILAAPSIDYYGHFRPFGAAVDIGAFEDGPWSGLEDMEGYLLKEYLLYQNYPNPFNPTTVVSYQLPAVSDVRLVVYDLLGREVAVLVNERKAPGRYEAKFDATGLATGVYLCRLTAGSFVQTRKMAVVK